MATNQATNSSTLTLADMNLAQPAQVPTTQPAGSARPQAQVWMNVGYNAKATNADGHEEERFISLPLGIALDTMEPRTIPNGNNRDYANMIAAQNHLLETLQKASEGLEPGEVKNVQLEIQIRKVSGPQEVDNTSNPYIKSFDI